MCQGMTYTGCGCPCHPEAANRRPRVVVPDVASVMTQPPLPAPVDNAAAARFTSWLLIVQGSLLMLGVVALVVVLLLDRSTGEMAGLADLALLTVVVGLFPVAAMLIALGCVARGHGLVAPIIGVAVHSLVTLMAFGAGGPNLVSLELGAAEGGLVVTACAGVGWWRTSRPA